MDYLFYGKVTVTRNVGLTTVSLDIECEPGEFIALYVWQPNDARQLAYQQWPCRRLEDHFTAQFDVLDDQVFLFTRYMHMGMKMKSQSKWHTLCTMGKLLHSPKTRSLSWG